MKKIYILFALLIAAFTINIKAQTAIKCSEICILGMSLDTINNELNVTVFNGANGSQINYPIIVVTNPNGDTIANINNQFFLFAQLTDDTVVHSIPTAINSLASNFTGTVYVTDPTDTNNTCAFTFPMICTVGINEYVQNNFSIYPNPANDNFTVDLSNFNIAKATIIIYDITGKQMIVEESSTAKTLVNVENFEAGIYFVVVSMNNKTQIKKVIVK